jgi:serine/threonine protein phosphatase PrpC
LQARQRRIRRSGTTRCRSMRATLWGIDHEELGPIASAAAGERAGVAISRGRFPKRYRYEDPNEDAVAAVAGPRATLLVIADGHNGATASHIAVQALLNAVGDDPPDGFGDADWLDLFAVVNDEVIAAKGPGAPHPASNTVLVAALASPGRLSWAAVGDSAIVVARPGADRGRQLNKEAMRFLGQPMSRRGIKGSVARGSHALEPEDWVALVTDGLSEFVAPLRPADVVPRVLSVAPDTGAQAAAAGLVEAACSAGAGDNVAAAVLAP